MSWVLVIWAMLAAACLTLAFTYVVIGTKQPLLRSHLLFAGAAVAVAAIAAFELMMMQSRSIPEYARLQRWGHVPVFVMFACIVFFVREYLCAGRLWLACVVVGVRLVSLVVNFTAGVSLNFEEIGALRNITFLGDTVTLAIGTLNPLGWLGPLSSLMLVVYVVDASRTAWRRGSPTDRHRAAVVGGSIVLFIAAATTHAQLLHRGLIESPYLISVAFFGTIAVMAYELGADAARSAELARDLSRNERRMQLAVEAAGVGLWEWDVKRDRVHIIHSDETRFPREQRELPNLEAYLATIHAEDRGAVRAGIRRALETGDDCRLEFRVLTRNPASPRWLGSRGRVEYGPDGQPVLMRGVVYDVTHRRLAQERVQVVLDATPNGFIMTNASGDVVMANAQTERILGYAKGELLGRKLETLVPDGLREAHASRRREYVSSPGPRAMALGRKVVGRRKDGSEVAVEIGLTPVDMPDGRFVLAAIVDITERERLKREAAQRMDELAHLSRVAVLGELSGSIAHELKQPLAAMLVNAQSAQRFLRASPASLGEVPPALADIVSEGQRAIELIDRLRDLFRKAEGDRKPLDVNAVVVETLAILRSELNYRALTPTLRLAPNLPPVAADRIQIQQVLLNLIMNAADAMRDLDAQNRHLTIQTARVDAGLLQVWISDSGHGISEDDLPRVFEPFMTSKQDGLGLGLAVCRTIVEAHGGAISAENNVDRGATFRVTLRCTSDKLR